MGKVSVRPMRPSDLDAVERVEQASFSDPWSRGMLADGLDNPLAVQLVAELAGDVVGYIFLRHVLDEGEITNLAVLPELRRTGAGGALLGEAIAQAKALGLRCLMLEVRASNSPAIALYEQLGFARVGIRPGYYQNPREDALLMELEVLS